MANYYLIWSILFTSFALMGAFDLITTLHKAERTRSVTVYLILEGVSMVGYWVLIGMLFSPDRVNEGFETPYKYLAIALSLLLWIVKRIAIRSGWWSLGGISLKDALRENQGLCFIFDSKGRLVQESVSLYSECFWLQNHPNRASFLKACEKNAYEGDFLKDPQLRIKLYTEQARKVVSLKKDTITNRRGDVIGEIWSGTDITELQTVYEALRESETELIEVQSVLVNYLEMVEAYERTKAEQDISLRMNELIGQEMMTLLKQLQVMEISLKDKDLTVFNHQLDQAITNCKGVIKDVRKTVGLISNNTGESL